MQVYGGFINKDFQAGGRVRGKLAKPRFTDR